MSNFQQTLLGRYASLEADVPAAGGVSDALQVGEVVDEDGAQLDGENLVENDLIEAGDEEEVIDEGSEEIEELVDTAEALESYLSAARSASKQGGWTTQEASAYHLGIGITMGRIGGDAGVVMHSLESFGTSRERINATTAVENRITETLKTIWEAIKRGVNKVIAFVRKWYLKIADGASRLKKRAESIRKKAEGTNGTAKEKKIRIPLAGLHINKQPPSPDQLTSALKGTKEAIVNITKGKMAKGFADGCDNIVKAIEALAEGKDPSAVQGAMKGLLASVTSSNSDLKASSEGKAKFPGANALNAVMESSSELPGGKKFFFCGGASASGDVETKDFAAATRSLGKMIVSDATSAKVELDSSKEVQILEPSQVVSVADAVIDLADAVIDFRKDFENYERKTKETLTKVDNVAKKSNKGENDAENEAAAMVRAFATGTGNLMRNHGTSITAVIGYGLNLGRNALVYGNSSLNQYKAD